MYIVKNSIEYFVFMFFSQLLRCLRNYKCEVCKTMYCCTAEGMWPPALQIIYQRGALPAGYNSAVYWYCIQKLTLEAVASSILTREYGNEL